ncbi:MAG: iron export ABC transporter permease subunit FetB [Candidatus Krumholzibacteriia bacterium]
MNQAIALGYGDLAVAALLLLVAGGVSVGLGLGLGRQLLLAAVRTVVQLLLVGYVLAFVFGLGTLPAMLAMAAVMIVAAARAAVRRPARTYRGAFGHAFVTLLLAGLVVTTTVTAGVIGVVPWFAPRYFIPLLGMILGNSLTGVSLGLDTLLERVSEQRGRVELELALGATGWEAARPHVREAVRRGLIPIVNSMMVVGLVSIPGMMTGQILAGADPIGAVKYQIMVMFMVAAGTSLGCIGVVLLAMRRVFNGRHQLDLAPLRKQAGP